ncbi:MAG: DUF1836 domain-containing protein [Oscillospiraceae bacterium]|nr:DUF1836 domain-containing protein [Oscillospiraceae bacterium]
MEELQELKRRLAEERPQAWDAMPDINLYMDQIISCMSRQMIHYDERDTLTSAMVNNYIKDGLLPRAEGKRYSRVHLGYLTAICALKQVLSVKDVGRLVKRGSAGEDPQALYAYFLQELDKALSATTEAFPADLTDDELPRLALELALRSYANRLACQRILDIMDARNPMPEKTEKAKKEKTAKPRAKAAD